MRVSVTTLRVEWLAVVFALVGAASAEDVKDTGKVMMWEVRSDKATAHILGSIHAVRSDMYPLDAAVEDAYAKADLLALEIDMSMETQIKAAGLIAQAGMYQGAETLSNNVSAETLARLATYLDSRGIPAAQCEKMKPWLVVLMLTMQEAARLGYNPQNGIDMYFYQNASRAGKPVVGLETPEEQVQMLSSGLASIQEKEILQFLDEVGEMEGLFSKMAAAWKAGDAPALERVINESLADDAYLKEFTENLIDKRNVRMADRISALLAEGKSPFVIIGSAHLVGEKGVPELLKQKGFTVTQMDKKGTSTPTPAVESTAPATR